MSQVALPDEPRTAAGLYWGYTTRIARGVGALLSECPFEVRAVPLLCYPPWDSCLVMAVASVRSAVSLLLEDSRWETGGWPCCYCRVATI